MIKETLIIKSWSFLRLNFEELKRWSREDVIDWLKWNDPNGIYTDKGSMAELNNNVQKKRGNYC
ncbi:MAG: hypothetical protein IPI60_00345 [Saprospiraceae bacterium]|nr:hypothetical protein [Saprospiraceae bacterium]